MTRKQRDTPTRTSKAAETRQREAKALEYRKMGLTYQQIADALEFTHRSAARKAVERALKTIIQEPAQELIEMELARLDTLQAGLWNAAAGGDVFAIDRVLAIQQQRDKYLGLTANIDPDPSKDARAALAGFITAVQVALATPTDPTSDDVEIQPQAG